MGSDLNRKLDYSDLQFTPDDGRRYELVRGDLLVTPSPNTQHQRVARELLIRLVAYFHDRGLGEVFIAPTDVILTQQDVFVPDLLVIADPGGVSKRGIEKAPLLVIEILSPSTTRVDRGLKAQRYAELGVEHYWLVDPERRNIECHRLDSGAFQLVVEVQGADLLTHPAWDGLSIDLARLWR